MTVNANNAMKCDDCDTVAIYAVSYDNHKALYCCASCLANDLNYGSGPQISTVLYEPLGFVGEEEVAS